MSGNIKWRVAVILGLIALCVWSLLPKEGPTGEPVPALNLGLDLEGGMYLALEVDDPEQTIAEEDFDDALERTLTTIRNRIDEFGVREPTIQRVGNQIVVELAGIDDPERAKEIVNRTAFMEFKMVTDGEDFLNALPRLDRAIVAALPASELESTPVQTELDLSSVLGQDSAGADVVGGDSVAAEPLESAPETTDAAVATPEAEQVAAATDTTDRAGDTAAGATAPGQDAEAAVRPLTALIRPGSVPGEYYIAAQDEPTVERYLALDTVRALLPRDVTVHWGSDSVSIAGASYRPLYILEATPLITGEHLADAGPAARDPTFNQPYVPFETTRRGARIFERGTSRNIGNLMAIVLDNRVQSYATIRQTLSRRAQIELGAGSAFQEAQDLALVLRAGALPMPIRIVEERTVTASLGEDSIAAGEIAGLIGLVAVMVIMVGYYRVAGLLALLAMATYVILLLGGLAGLGATLTLPGIAGLILSVGMAVDANVLIFERIREELDAGKTPRTAVDAGFANALSAIVDANLTTLITGIILYQFGTGPVRGFAVTLCIGILASFFSAVYVTRTLFTLYLNRRGTTESISI